MVVEVGDKVVVWGAGTESAFAKKVEPIKVGDTVDVITLSDGTKIPLPRLELDLSDYVWVLPEWDPNMDLNSTPISWGALPLGACYFTVTGKGINLIVDENREWVPGDLAGCFIVFLSGKLRGGCLEIVNNSETTYSVRPLPDVAVEWEVTECIGDPTKITCNGDNVFAEYGAGHFVVRSKTAIPIVGKYLRFSILLAGRDIYIYGGVYSQYYGDVIRFIGGNSSYPDADEYTLETGVVSNSYVPAILVNTDSPGSVLEIRGFGYVDELDCVDEIEIGDRYVIYDPETKRLKFNDAARTILAAASWRAVNYPGEIVSAGPIEYVWDGSGTVYLSQSKTIKSTMFYDNELRVEAFGDTGDVRAIDYHECDTFTYSGETVSRELVNISSILRAGKNYVKIYAKDTGGTAVGFPTPVYIIRTME